MPIMWGLAIGAAMGGGIAALRGGKTEDILKGAAIGGATGALGGGISSLASAGTAGAVGSGVANVAPAATTVGTNLGTNLLASSPGAATGVIGGDAGAFMAADQAASTAGTGFFDSGIGKTLFENKGMLGAGALGLLALNKPGSSSSQSDQQTDSYIRPYEFKQVENPDYQGAGTPYFKQSYTAKAPIKANEFGATTVADGGVIRMADGGVAGLAPNNQFLGSNSIYPTSHIDHTQYSTSSQLPTSAAIRDADYDTPTAPYTGQEMIRMAEGGEAEAPAQETNPTLAALMAIQQSQRAYEPPAPAVSQGISQPMIQPQMAQIQQHYAAPQRQAPEAFQYQTPAFVKYGVGNLGGNYGSGSSGVDGLIDPITKQPVKSAASIIAANTAAAKKPTTGVSGTYTGPGIGGDAESYYDRYPVADVYDYANNQPTRPSNPTEGSPEFNVPSNVPVDLSSGMAATQQQYANMGYTDYLPNPQNVDGGGANGGLMPQNLRYAAGGGIGDLGSYSDGGRLLKGPGDGVSDDIPAQIGAKQPARLADGEFVVPARIVSELGNGSTDAGAKRLYAMMDRIQNNRRKTVGKGKVAVNSKSDKYLPA